MLLMYEAVLITAPVVRKIPLQHGLYKITQTFT